MYERALLVLLLLNVLAVQQTRLDSPIAGCWHLAG
jgi:hypothetical protein